MSAGGHWDDDADIPVPYRLSEDDMPVPYVPAGHLPAWPLLERIEARGGISACGVAYRSGLERVVHRARVEGVVSERVADRIAVRVLGMTLWDFWPATGGAAPH